MKCVSRLFFSLVAILSMLGSGCASPTYQQRQSEINSSGLGAVTGGILGGVIAHNMYDGDDDKKVLGAAIGAVAGGLAGQKYGQGQDYTRQRIESLESQASMETIMIQNSNGSHTPVVLTKVGYGQYRGPRGEIYTSRPTDEQLRAAYGF